MQLMHRVALDGVELDSVDSRIMISKIETGDGKDNVQTVSLWGDSTGSRVTNVHRDSLDITVKFRIRLKKRNMAEREEVIEKVNAWAFSGGWLTTNYKDNRRIRVFRQQAATPGDPWEWTKEYAVVFRACGVPYWQEEKPNSVQKQSVSSANLVVGVNGSARTVLEAEFKNTSNAACNTFSLTTNESQMSFSSLGLAAGETLVIDHNDTGKKSLLRIRIKNTSGAYRSAMSKRTTGSSDDLYISPGTKTVAMAAGKAGTITLKCRGRYA